MAIPLLPAPSPTITHSFTLFIRAFYPLPDPSHPLPLPPTPIFAFLADSWTLFACIFILSYLYMYIHDT
ncbi:hypothetical protein PILCRDRAFT_822757 [Piloderma croceum F 1598]|uniref:Uncharacterized protein n=1 Tax=Piloderma croceum (strain F 1598) TaxID=765440 RepID=A0A0C3B214_PILCF|nr:hypothetical protein PILCRDRAFT_822757 [Piloderma croceum F 1598]